MIYDIFENIELYCQEGEALHRAIAYARDFDASQEDGLYEVEGRDIYARVMSYDTAPFEEQQFESHRDYLDVQVLLSGCERLDVALAKEEDLDTLKPYDSERDVVKLKAPDDYASISLVPGRFAVFYPNDIHRPNCDLSGKSQVKKICMKVRCTTQSAYSRRR